LNLLATAVALAAAAETASYSELLHQYAAGDRAAAVAELSSLEDGQIAREQAFAAIVATMNSRYVLRFEPAAGSAPGWHAIQLRLRGAKGDVRARAGYFRRGGS
jgi:hypothetical protein